MQQHEALDDLTLCVVVCCGFLGRILMVVSFSTWTFVDRGMKYLGEQNKPGEN
jgi:hypothetical protein